MLRPLPLDCFDAGEKHFKNVIRTSVIMTKLESVSQTELTNMCASCLCVLIQLSCDSKNKCRFWCKLRRWGAKGFEWAVYHSCSSNCSLCLVGQIRGPDSNNQLPVVLWTLACTCPFHLMWYLRLASPPCDSPVEVPHGFKTSGNICEAKASSRREVFKHADTS